MPEMIEKYQVKDKKDQKKLDIMKNYLTQLTEFEHIADRWLSDLEDLAKMSFRG